jgi:predicted DNA-binding transcriptional regulator YafY
MHLKTNMPKNDKKSTLLRQWEMMRMLTVSRYDKQTDGRWDKASEITAKLNDQGYAVSVRTVQRDLQELSHIFDIEINNKNPRDYGWRWRKGANLNIPGMSVSEALAMCLVETHMKQLLPTTMLGGLQGVFSLAQAKLDKVEAINRNHTKDWLNKVRVVPPSQPMLPPSIDQLAQADIYQALLESKQIKANYHPVTNNQSKEYLLHPLGLIMRGALSYLVASAWDYSEVQLYALHRFNKVEILHEAVNVPHGFNLDKSIQDGLAEFANQGSPIQLELRCRQSVANYLAETPLSLDQKIEMETDGWVQLTATVNDTWQLHWWLMGQGDAVEVCAPAGLRQSIAKALADANKLYS